MQVLDTLERERLALRERLNTERYEQECEEYAKMQMRPLIEEHAKMLMAQVISDHMECDSLRQASIQKNEEERGFTWGEGFMNTAQFRIKREEDRFPLLSDQDVSHIIAWNNGGADHEDNYFVLSRSLNRSLGSGNDHLMAEMAGLEQTKKAVAVSRTTGYTGPGAEELIAMAKAEREEAKAARAEAKAAREEANAVRTAAARPPVRKPVRNVRVPTKHVKVNARVFKTKQQFLWI